MRTETLTVWTVQMTLYLCHGYVCFMSCEATSEIYISHFMRWKQSHIHNKNTFVAPAAIRQHLRRHICWGEGEEETVLDKQPYYNQTEM